MKSPGGSKQKGNRFERLICQELSLWITKGKRNDIFSRNVLSGGRFTNTEKLGREFGGLPGDVIAAHPLAFSFSQCFSVECKHGADPDLEKFLMDTKHSSFLSRTFSKARRQAQHLDLATMVAARKNRGVPFVIVSGDIGMLALKASKPPYTHHLTHNGTYAVISLANLRNCVDPAVFMASVAALLKGINNEHCNDTLGSDDRDAVERPQRRDAPEAETKRVGPVARRSVGPRRKSAIGGDTGSRDR